MTAIILAGGMGTRLKSVINDIPKPMAPIAGRPFLQYLLRWLTNNGVERIILSIGYMGESIQSHFGSRFEKADILYSLEESPLGTGGAIKKALEFCESNRVLVLNGDTFFDIDIRSLHNAYADADLTIALKEMRNFDRYGTVSVTDEGRVSAFIEKRHTECGFINGGIYLIKRTLFEGFDLPEKFSFERFMEDNADKLAISGLPFEGNFIDIGIPEDYAMAQTLMHKWVSL
ncbi:MAG: nucleotidyltransferase family protein [Lachnospiraceae bacterium]|jgi:D-glycero-alpha-D-manno-heptose 1-phosphate guanylyltransferase|nr:nucleotidyltransferase family protein [Lachnospiraceae bacterium]